MVVGGCERAGGFNLPYTDCYDPVTGEWKSLAKHPEFTKSEYGVCALRNDILVSGELAVQALSVGVFPFIHPLPKTPKENLNGEHSE